MLKSKSNNITILNLITFFSSLYFYHQIITLYFLQRGLNYVEINSLWGIIAASKAIAEVPTGIVADKIGRKFSIIIALALQLAGEIIFIFADRYLLFVLTAVIGGIGFAFLSGCFEAIMYDSLKKEGRESEMQKVAGMNASFSQMAIIIGSFIGGFITSNLRLNNFILVIVMTAFFVGIALIISFFLKEPSTVHRQETLSSLALLTDGMKLLRTNRPLQRIILLFLLATPFINYLLNFYQPYFVKARLSGVWFGIGLSLASLLGVLSSKYAYSFEKIFGVKNGVLLATLLPGIFYIFMAMIFYPWIAFVLFILSYGSMQVQRPIFVDYMNRHIESRNRATVLSLINVFSGIYIALMGLLIGWLADFSLSYAFILMGSVIIFSALFIRIEARHVKKI